MDNVTIRVMKPEDYECIYRLWCSIKGLGIRSIDDSETNIVNFIRRNPTTSFVAECEGNIVATLMCGHDGRRASFYHVCVDVEFRKKELLHRWQKKHWKHLKKKASTK